MQILTYETMPENTDLTNAKALRRVHCKQSYLYETFWHTETCLYTTFDMRVHVCVQFLTLFPVPSPNATRLYKIVSTVRRDDVHVFT